MVSKSEAVPLGTPPPPVSDAKSEKIQHENNQDVNGIRGTTRILFQQTILSINKYAYHERVVLVASS